MAPSKGMENTQKWRRQAIFKTKQLLIFKGQFHENDMALIMLGFDLCLKNGLQAGFTILWNSY